MTREIIKKEIKYLALNTIKGDVPWLVFAAVLLILSNVISTYSGVDELWFFVPFILLIGVMLYIFTFELIYSIKRYKAADKDEFDIVMEKLVETKDKRTYHYDSIRQKAFFNTSVSMVDTTSLFFMSGKKYSIPLGLNYGWSPRYCMDYIGVFRSSKIGDEFYLVVIDNQKVVLAYNTKFFELKD